MKQKLNAGSIVQPIAHHCDGMRSAGTVLPGMTGHGEGEDL